MAIELLWNPPTPPARGPRQRLTLAEVIDAAIDLADTEGVDGLSMRALGARLGVGTMSLYTYVPGRDELFELMIDRAWAMRGTPDRGLTWRAQVMFHAEQAWAMYQRHPWLITANLWRTPLGPNVLDAQEDLYRAVDLTGLPAHDVARITGMVESHVFGLARARITENTLAAQTGVSTDDYWASRSSFWETYYSADRFPTMTRLWEAGAFDQPEDDPFGFQLRVLLDGVELLVSRSARP